MSKKIIDVSEHQGTINWEAVKGQIDGAIIRCGYGDNATSQDDIQWNRNSKECERLGIPYGAYLYSYCNSESHLESEVAHIKRLLSGRKLSLPFYIDIEDPGLSFSTFKADYFIRMGQAIEDAGYWFGVYANLNWFNNCIGGKLNRFTKWCAAYGTNNGQPQVRPNIGEDIWQYSSAGSIQGIEGNVDMNLCYRDFVKEIKGGSTAPTPSYAGTPGVDFTYMVYTENDGWLPEVVNLNDFAGIRGHWIRKIAIKVNKGSIKYRVHVMGVGWLPWVTGYNKNDHNNGYAGNGQPIDAIEIYYETPADYAAKYGYQKAQYRVSPVNGGYWPWQYDNETSNGQDGYAGCFGQPIDRFQIF